MITEYHFPTPIYIKDIPNAAKINSYLEEKILKWQQEDLKGKQRTNAGGWHSQTAMNKRKEYNVLTNELLTYNLKYIKKYI